MAQHDKKATDARNRPSVIVLTHVGSIHSFFCTSLSPKAFIKIYYGAKNPFIFMELHVQELANFFKRRVSAYQVALAGDVSFNEAF